MNNYFLDYDIASKKARSPKEEWQPHKAQTDKTMEWWYLTALVHDVAGNPYFIFWCDFQFAGKNYIRIIPNLLERMQPGQTLFNSIASITDYTNQYHKADGDASVMMESDAYDPATNSVFFKSQKRNAKWSYDGCTSHLSLKSEVFNAELSMLGADDVMYAKDKYNAEGFIQEGAEDDLSFYWSLPRLPISGTISYTDNGGVQHDLFVTGQGWIDRQWGDFMTKSWEWNSFRFINGARVNLYNFANGYQVATYQKPDGSTEWFDHFTVKQNGYSKTPIRNIWFSFGWTYEFPIEIEGSKRYTVIPYSAMDTYDGAGNSFFEGPGKLINDETGKTVGIGVTESMDVRVMNNTPYGENQH